MSEKIYSNFSHYLLLYLLFITISSFVILGSTFNLDTNNSIAEWIINYQGGFGRRGLAGELLLIFSILSEIHLKKIVLFFIYFIVSIYHIFLFIFLKKIKFNFYLILAVLSPLFVIFPVSEIEALGRKDILIPLFFLIFCMLYEKSEPILLIFYLIILNSFLIFTHEVSIFYLPFFYLLIIFKLDKLNVSIILLLITSSIYFLTIILLFIKFNHTEFSIIKMCEILKNNFDTKCGLGAYVLDRSLIDNIKELNGIKFIDIIRAILIFFFGSIGLLILLFNTEKNMFAKNNLFKDINFKHIYCFMFLCTLIPFFIAVDWGRWFNLSYTMCTLFFIFCLKNKIIFLYKENNLKSFKFFEKKKIYLGIVLFVICFSWNPKAIYSDDVGSIPIYRVSAKVFKIIDNSFN